MQSLQKFCRINGRLAVQMLQNDILGLTHACNFLSQKFLIEKLAYLETDLCIFIRIERCNTGLGGTEGLAAQSLLLVLVK